MLAVLGEKDYTTGSWRAYNIVRNKTQAFCVTHHLSNNPNETFRNEDKGQMSVDTSGWEDFRAHSRVISSRIFIDRDEEEHKPR